MVKQILTPDDMEIYAGRVISIYNTYINIISPMIVEIELLDGEYPIEIMNEIRAVFTHLSRYYTKDDLDIKIENVLKAESHIKRAVLDCFKYSCFSYSEYQLRFETRYKKVDLSMIDNGQFLDDFLMCERQAAELFNQARRNEIENPLSENLYTDYEAAYAAFNELYETVESVKIHAEKLRRKAVFKDWLTIGSFIIGAVGVLLTIISYL
jgi:hypothetical protein